MKSAGDDGLCLLDGLEEGVRRADFPSAVLAFAFEESCHKGVRFKASFKALAHSLKVVSVFDGVFCESVGCFLFDGVGDENVCTM